MASPMPNLQTEEGFVDIFCANVDGKYEEEVVKVNDVVNGDNDQLIFKVYTPNLYAGIGLKYTRTYNFSTVLTDASKGKSVHPKFYFSGDFNGNGKMEVLAVSCNHPLGNSKISSKCYLFDLEEDKKLYENYVFPYNVDFVGNENTDADKAFDNTDRLFVLDYDGDGKSDICLINDSGTNIYTFDISGSTYSMRKVATYTGLTKTDLEGRKLMPGEFDGDGLIDLLVSPEEKSSTPWEIYHSKGNGYFDKTTCSGPYRNASSATSGFMLQDINGDGLTDLVRYSKSYFYTYLSKNGTISATSECYSSKTANAALVSTNINSRNVFSNLITLNNGDAVKYIFKRNDTREKMLTSAVSSLGVVYTNDYEKLNSSSFVYTQGSGAQYPYQNYNGPLWVVSGQETMLGTQKKADKTYRYYNAVIHKQGLGFQGFERIMTYDNFKNQSYKQEIKPYYYAVPDVTESPTEKNTFYCSVCVQSNKIRKTRLTKKVTYNKLSKITVTSTYTYDTYGNVLIQTDSYPGNITVKTTNKYANTTSDDSYLLGFLSDQTVQGREKFVEKILLSCL